MKAQDLSGKVVMMAFGCLWLKYEKKSWINSPQMEVTYCFFCWQGRLAWKTTTKLSGNIFDTFFLSWNIEHMFWKTVWWDLHSSNMSKEAGEGATTLFIFKDCLQIVPSKANFTQRRNRSSWRWSSFHIFTVDIQKSARTYASCQDRRKIFHEPYFPPEWRANWFETPARLLSPSLGIDKSSMEDCRHVGWWSFFLTIWLELDYKVYSFKLRLQTSIFGWFPSKLSHSISTNPAV